MTGGAKFKPKEYLCRVKIDRNIAVAFTGHRTYDGSSDAALRAAIRRFYDNGYRIFLTGMALGFDLAAGECAVALRRELPDIAVVCAVPFYGQERRFGADARARYGRLAAAADEVAVLAENYTPRVYHLRNDFLVDNASAVIAYYDGSAGGTAYTVRRALKQGLYVENIWQGLFL